MTRPSSSSVGLLLLMIGCAAAGESLPPASEKNDLERIRDCNVGRGPEFLPRPRAERSTTCQEHTRLHESLDEVEKKVEDTLAKFEAELAPLLEIVESPQWGAVIDGMEQPTVDILEDPDKRGQS